jgi:tetratricopeptide (TPR) repeat protein
MARANTVAIALTRSLLVTGNVTEAQQLSERVVARIDASAEPSLAASAHNELARTHLFSGRGRPALQVVEEGLAIAERSGLGRETAELFITKSWAIDAVGRPREAMALAQAGLEMSEESEHTPGMLRARMNLSNVLLVADPRRGRAVAKAGTELALRIAHADWAATVAGNYGLASLLTGDWAEAIADLEPLDRDYLTLYARATMNQTRRYLQAFAGHREPPGTDGLVDAVLQSDLAQGRAIAYAASALEAFGRGDAAGVAEPARTAARESPEAREGLVALIFMGRAALQLRDVALAREAVELVTSRSADSGWIRVALGELRAGIAALEGDAVNAEAAFRQAIEGHRRLGLPSETALAVIELLELVAAGGGGHDELRDEARSVVDRLGYAALGDRLAALGVADDRHLAPAR